MGSGYDLCMLSTRLNGDMCRREVLSMDKGRWKCSDISDSIKEDVLLMTDILPVFAK